MDPLEIRDTILKNTTEPLVFKNFIQNWPSSKWNFTNISQIFDDRLLKFRIGKNDVAAVNLETECDYKLATISEFCQWLENACGDGNPLKNLSIKKYWCYADYKHMCEIFEEESEMFQKIDWSCFGFPSRGGKESTIWIGSQRASTVCHFDSYGCNLVAQICGRKRWILFPPDQSEAMYPSRLPFEESSHFSRVNILRPDLERFPLFKATTPYMVTLQPGDVLFVPHHWWHHVECLEPSISINTWLELEVDHLERVREAVAKNVVYKLMEGQGEGWLNPTEECTSDKENLNLLNMAMNMYFLQKEEFDNKDNDDGEDDGGDDDDDGGGDDDGDHTKTTLNKETRKRARTKDISDTKKLRPNLPGRSSNKEDKNESAFVNGELDRNRIIVVRPSTVIDLISILRRGDDDDVQSLENGGRNEERRHKEASLCSSDLPEHTSITSQVQGHSKPHRCFKDVTIEQLTRSILQHDVIKLVTENLLNNKELVFKR